MVFCRKVVVTGTGMLLFALILMTISPHRHLCQLQSANEDLQRELAVLREAQPATQGGGLSVQEEPEGARQERLDLLRLRNEVGQLRNQQKELDAAHLENAQLRVALRALEAANAGAQSSFALDSVPRPNAWIGANIMTLPDTSDPAMQRVMVGGIVNNGPAAEAGLQPDDVVISAEGQAITNVWQFISAVTNGVPGQQLLLDVVRDGTPLQVLVTRQEPPVFQQQIPSKWE